MNQINDPVPSIKGIDMEREPQALLDLVSTIEVAMAINNNKPKNLFL